MKKLVAVVISVFLLVSSSAYANSGGENWPTWRGPDATGAAGSGNPPLTWSEKENIKWKVEFPGEGLSTPIIWENKIFFLTAIESEKEGAYKFDFVCMDRSNGEILWQKTAVETVPHEGHHDTSSFASNSAVTDGEFVWASFGSRGVHCYDMDVNHKWSKDLGKMKMVLAFGEGASAALAGNALIVVMDQQVDSFVYALNKDTGDIIWQKARDEASAWATPLPIEVNGKLQVVTSATNLIRSYDVENGDIVWQCSGQTNNVIPSPVTGFDMVICTSGYRGNKMQAIKLGHTGDLSGTDAVKWEVDSRTTPYVPSPLLYWNRIYIHTNNDAVLSCYDARTGKPYYESQEIEGANGYYASPVGAADRVYLASQNGVTIVIKNSDTYEVLASNKLDDRFDASPVVVGDELFLKGKEYLYCISEP